MTDELERLLSTEEVARLTGYSSQCLRVLRRAGDGPRFVQRVHRGLVRYRRSDVEAWLQQNARWCSTPKSSSADVPGKPVLPPMEEKR